jgi:hypothetical protein
MTVLGAVVFGGLLTLGVLWLLVTAPASDGDQMWTESGPNERVGAVSAGSGSRDLIDSLRRYASADRVGGL